jgi:hypothetical protein
METKKNPSAIKRILKKTIWIVSLALILILGIFFYWKFFFTYSEGYRAGLLQKFSYKGNVFKTYEGEIILSSVTSTKNVALASEKFLFSVNDKILASQLDTLQGQFLIVHYKQKNSTLPWRGESLYLVDSAKVKN